MTRLSDATVNRLRDIAVWPDLPPDRYEIRSVIGRGGMGAVYLAQDRLLDREVALKVSSAASADGALEARLRQEAVVLSKLEHPGIVPVHDAGRLADGRWFYVMKFVRGTTLHEHAATLSGEAAILGVFERIVETVAFAHAAGIVHRDLKPSNIMVGSFGEVLVLDWGVARVLASDSTLDAGVRVGTPGFMAPEQREGGSAGPAADVYSLGRLLTWLVKDMRLPIRLRAIMARCQVHLPRDRYVDARDLCEDITRYRADHPVEAHKESVFERGWRWADRYRTFIGLVLAYLLMRLAFAWWSR